MLRNTATFFLLFSASDAIFGCGTSKKLTTAGRLLAQVATIPWSTPVWKSLETVTPFHGQGAGDTSASLQL